MTITSEIPKGDNGGNDELPAPEDQGTNPRACCGVWAPSLDGINEKLYELDGSHQRLCRLTKQAYQHAQQTWHQVISVSEKVDGLIVKSERDSIWQRNVGQRLDAIEAAHTALSVQLDSMSALIRGLTTAVMDTRGASSSPDASA